MRWHWLSFPKFWHCRHRRSRPCRRHCRHCLPAGHADSGGGGGGGGTGDTASSARVNRRVHERVVHALLGLVSPHPPTAAALAQLRPRVRRVAEDAGLPLCSAAQEAAAAAAALPQDGPATGARATASVIITPNPSSCVCVGRGGDESPDNSTSGCAVAP